MESAWEGFGLRRGEGVGWGCSAYEVLGERREEADREGKGGRGRKVFEGGVAVGVWRGRRGRVGLASVRSRKCGKREIKVGDKVAGGHGNK
ncbi:hypothetical protein Ccrd_010326, partial [Cynara cardunculus var. scolymus]